MPTTQRIHVRFARARARLGAVAAILAVSLTSVSAHVVKGLLYPDLATAFVSSPSATADPPIKVMWGAVDTKLRVACFYTANTSVPRLDEPGWPRITAVGFELPGAPSGFSLLEPLEGWELVEGRRAALPGNDSVTLDFALVAVPHRGEWSHKWGKTPAGIPPGQEAKRGSGTRFCVSGPFPDTLPNPADPNTPLATTIELLVNSVVVRFQRVQPHGPSVDMGVWDNPARAIPYYEP